EITYTSVLFAVQTVWPVREFDAHALTTFGVGICCGVMLFPSTFTTATFVNPPPQCPLGTYATTFVPVTSTDSALDGWHKPVARFLSSLVTVQLLWRALRGLHVTELSQSALGIVAVYNRL